ncbi:MAG: alpha/beta fold hydrolase [Alphaproteobacteria bacterium]|nr:MAG: alpha/beta fold hydrolase [Alphaproteobacteria bacterium]
MPPSWRRTSASSPARPTSAATCSDMARAAVPRARPAPLGLLALALFVALGGCVERARLVPLPEPEAARETLAVFVGTSRRLDPERGFGKGRSGRLLLARYDISVPPMRAPGTLSWPHPGEAPDPERDFLVARAGLYPDAGGFRADLARELRRRDPVEREAVIYVHGFNNSFDEALLRLAQLAEDFALPAAAVHFSWPSAASPFGYAYDRESALYSRDALLQLIGEVEAAGARRVILVGHSVGAMLVMEALREMAIAAPGSPARRIAGVVLISPDIDVELFRMQAHRIGRLPQPFGIFVSRRDRALQVSAALTGQRDRLGNLRSVERIADLDVTLVDITAFTGDSVGHFVLGTSPALIRLFTRADAFDAAFRKDSAGNLGPAIGTILTVRNASAIIVDPAAVN